jgi:hypothetical protein
MSFDEYAAGRGARPLEVDFHDGVDGFACARVVFPHPDPALPAIEEPIAVAQMAL